MTRGYSWREASRHYPLLQFGPIDTVIEGLQVQQDRTGMFVSCAANLSSQESLHACFKTSVTRGGFIPWEPLCSFTHPFLDDLCSAEAPKPIGDGCEGYGPFYVSVFGQECHMVRLPVLWRHSCGFSQVQDLGELLIGRSREVFEGSIGEPIKTSRFVGDILEDGLEHLCCAGRTLLHPAGSGRSGGNILPLPKLRPIASSWPLGALRLGGFGRADPGLSHSS